MTVGKISFSGKIPNVVESVNPRSWAKKLTEEKELKAEMLNAMPKPIKMLDKMKNFVGEVPNIIINAIGTGLIAPVFIKYNFLSKTDEDTRTYSAMRQPVSAALAVVTQAGVVIQFNNAIDKMINKGNFIYKPKEFNKTAYQDVEYLEKIIKKENPNLAKAEITKMAKAKQYSQFEDMLEHLYNKGTIQYTDNKGQKVSLEAQDIKKLFEQTTDDMLKNVKDNPAEKAVIERMKQAIAQNKQPQKLAKELQEISKGIPETNFVFNAVQKHISNSSANIKGMKQITGLVVSLAMLPITCSLLNYLYPKFMNLFFPELSNKKAKKTQDTFTKTAVAPKTESDKVRQGGAQ